MKPGTHSQNDITLNIPEVKIKILPIQINRIETGASIQSIRFEERKERYIWVHPDEIYFVQSADHYVKALIKCGRQKKWMIRHCTMKELLVMLPEDNFMRLNKFYLINLNYFSYVNYKEKLLYLDDEFSIPVPHRISPYLLHLLNGTHT